MGKKPSNNIKKEFENLRNNLLDLTLRNQLLNYKPRSKTIEVVNQSPMSVYQTLILQKKKMQFVPNKKERKSSSKDGENNTKKSRFSALWEHPPIDLSIFSEGDKSLKADLTPKELQKRLFYINQQANTMFQEQGYNILYLAIGFLEWRDTIKPNEVHAAPLILIPVSIERKKVGKSFSIYWNEEDIQSNISLQAKLAEEGIELPEFKITSYIEGVEHYLRDIKNAVTKMKNWKVTKHISLGFFSFTKFVMYNDLNPESWEENVDLTKHELIESIFNPKKNNHDQSFNEEDVDKELLYKDMYQVLDADSSQIAVIEDVKSGRNLVVEGPPGTGKSQTIVNVIAELLASGKSVLFVSEKMAALEVVKNRLDNVGLGKFVLELHSHKTKRKKLLKELQKALNVRAIDDININQTLRKLEKLRHQLDEYAEIIHQPVYNVQMSPFDLYGMKEYAEDHFSKKGKGSDVNESKISTILPLVRFKSPENYTLKDLDDMIIDLENLAELHGTISKNNPWSKCSPKSLLPSDLREIEMLINDTLDSLTNFSFESENLYENFGIKTAKTLREYERSLESIKLLDNKSINLIDSKILTNKCWIDNPNKANELIEKLENYQMTSKVMKKFNDNVFSENLDKTIINLEKETNKRFKLFGGKNHKEELKYLYKREVPNDKTALNDLKTLKEHIKFKKEINDMVDIGIEYFGELWHLDASIVDLKDATIFMRKFIHLLKEGIYNENTINLLSNSMFDVDSKSEIKNYLDLGDKFIKNLSDLENKLNPRSKLIFKKETKDVPFIKWEKQLNSWRGQISSLHLWSQYLNTKNSCLSTPAKLFVNTVEKRNIKKDDVKPLVLGNFADSLLNIVFAENQSLATFIGELHQNKISEFKELDSKIIEINRRRIFQKLNKKVPKVFGAAENPEAKTLAGEFTRKRGHLPVRTLLEKSGGIIKQIKPCFMMSPLSIAQYLDPTNPKLQFDVVIFDEASQVKPEDALGAFMRAKTAVVMGDTQQLPPTSFFDQMTGIDDIEEVATALDMESILHLCKLSFPVKMLKWHYRSRHESLIAVSNKEFYDDELLVYPSPSHNTKELGLKFKHDSSTVYERGKSSANPLEARAVVKEIFKHFNKYGDRKSLGIGTFSVAQMNAILEELEIERKLHPELEPLFSDKMKERFFVKNLETIQGDERDVILISVGYGFDQNRKMSLNFGPLNQDGGERRLNVLITRAREKCVVFSNFKAHDMHLTVNPPFGVKALKEFLEYAENISHGNIITTSKSDEPFEEAVYTFLTKNGYKVDKKIGCAGFRVDLAIIDEHNPGKYIVGIECDGKIYSSSKVARDRDRLREQVLTGLGWNLYHLWSTDWYRNRDLAREKLISAIEKIKAKSIINELESMEIKKIPSEEDNLTIVNPIEDDDIEEISHENILNYDNDEEDIENSIDNENIIHSIDNSETDKIDINKTSNLNDEDRGIIIENTDYESNFDSNKNKDFDIDNLDNESNKTNNNKNINNNKNKINKNKINTNEIIGNETDTNEISDNKIENDKISTNETDNNNNNNNINDNIIDTDRNNINNNKNESINENIINKKINLDKANSKELDYDKINTNSLEKIEEEEKLIKPKIKFRSHLMNKTDDDIGIIDYNNKQETNIKYNNGKKTNKENTDEENTNRENTNIEYNNKKNINIKDINKEHNDKKNNDNNYIEDELEKEIKKALSQISEYSDESKNKNEYNSTEQLTSENIIISENTDLKNNINPKDSINYNTENDNEKNIKNIEDNDIKNYTENNFNNSIKNSFEDDFEENSIKNNTESEKDDKNIHNETYYNNKDIEESTSTTPPSDTNRESESKDEEFQDLDFDGIMTYEGASNMDNPLRRNSFNYNRNKEKNFESQNIRDRMRSVSQSINEIKNEVKYINKSLKEIENPTAPKKVFVIDRTLPVDDYDVNHNYNQEDYKSNANEDNYENHTKYDINGLNLNERLKSNDDNVNSENYSNYSNSKDNLENIIQDLNEDYIKIEKERAQKINQLKEKDTTKTIKKEDINDLIAKYKTAKDIPVNKAEEFYNSTNKKLLDIVNSVVIVEGPIHISEFTTRIKESCNLKRAGPKFKKHIDKSISLAEKENAILIIDDFLFPSDWTKTIVRKRVNPNIDLISKDEIEENIKIVLDFISPINQKELIKRVSRNFGFKSTSKKTSNKISGVIDYMFSKQIINNNNGEIESIIKNK
jgi:superfamily I DNA and/or RNA helicase